MLYRQCLAAQRLWTALAFDVSLSSTSVVSKANSDPLNSITMIQNSLLRTIRFPAGMHSLCQATSVWSRLTVVGTESTFF